MAVKFLSQEWSDAVQNALNGYPGFKSAIVSTDLGLQFHITETPEGDVNYYLQTSGGSAVLALGSLQNPDITIGQTYETARGIFSGELATQNAFMAGKLKVSGNMAKLLMNQNVITQMQAALKGLEVEY